MSLWLTARTAPPRAPHHEAARGGAFTFGPSMEGLRTMTDSTPMKPPAGWYDDGSGRERWFDGVDWTDHFLAPREPETHSSGPMTSASLNVRREVFYNRPQTGHSLVLHLMLGWIVLYIPTIYYAASPNHYFHI